MHVKHFSTVIPTRVVWFAVARFGSEAWVYKWELQCNGVRNTPILLVQEFNRPLPISLVLQLVMT